MDTKKSISENKLAEDIQASYKINHLISANRLSAYIRIELLDEFAEIPPEEIFNYLKEQNIVYGIQKDSIVDFCKNKQYSKELLAARGKRPIDGKDAKLIYNFDIEKDKAFKEDDDGTIDFRNLDNIINVKKDTILSYIIPPSKGEDGIDVYGNPIKYKEGKNVRFDYGNNTYISKDGLQLLASTDGAVEYKKGKVFVKNIYRVKDVDNSTGNINFVGDVLIDGDVKEGFTVTAKGSIKIRGMVEGAYIKSDASVVIGRGMNGMSKGSIYAKGNITSKYIENATIVSEQNVYAEALINSDVKAGDSVIIKGSTASIIGGRTYAENLIYAKTIGNKVNAETNLIIGLKKYYEKEKLITKKKESNKKLERELSKKTKDLKELEKKIKLIMKSDLSVDKKTSLQKQLLLVKVKLNTEIQKLKSSLSETTSLEDIRKHRIICRGIIYSNTRITVGFLRYRVRQDINYSKIYNDGEDIAIVTLNPADLDIN